MADEDFQESEVLFQENAEPEKVQKLADDEEEEKLKKVELKVEYGFQIKSVVDMNDKSVTVPVNNLRLIKNLEKKPSFFEDEYKEDYGERVPPNLIISRRIARNVMAFSMCMGYGRTLKGRDLFQVRNSVLRMTGFLETGV
ncbi:unnamed protein product [Withania somnifera]